MIQKLSNWINNKVGFDGLLHIIICCIINSILLNICNVYLACSITLTIGLLKEAYDSTGKGTPEIKDVMCDIAGIVISLI